LDPPVLELGEEDSPRPELVLTDVTSAVRLPSGKLAIANAGTSEIRYFGAKGGYLRRVGRRGEGPGDFSGSSMYLWASGGDGLTVYDGGIFRLTSLGSAAAQ
jgi:hypothetical protein